MAHRLRSSRWWRFVALGLLVAVAAALVPISLMSNDRTPVAAPMASLTPVATTPLTAFVGDSSVAGAGASKKTERWTTLAAGTLGWREQNLARAGSGYGEDDGRGGCDGADRCTPYVSSLPEVQRANPSVVVVASGPVASTADTSELATQISSYYRQLRAALPDATIVALGPWSATGKPTASDKAVDDAVEAAAKAVRGVHVSLLSPVAVDASMTTNRGAALNDVGHQAVADRLVSALDDSGTS